MEINVEEEEKRIVRVIGRILKDRNRAGFQSILSFCNRENKDLDMDTLKSLLTNMVEKNLVYNKNKGDPEKESFKLFDNDENLLESSTQTFFQEPEVFVNIDSELDNTLKEIIKSEVKNYISDDLKEMVIDAIKEVKTKTREIPEECKNSNKTTHATKECQSCDSDLLLTSVLNDHIVFLQSQLQSKDAIIKMLITDRNNSTQFSKQESGKSSDAFQNKDVMKVEVSSSRNVVEKNANVKNIVNKTQHDNIQSIFTEQEMKRNKGSVDDGYEKVTRRKTSNHRTIAILGDSMLKDVDPFDLRKKLKNKNEKVYRHNFNGATINAMKHHAVPVMEFNPDLAILHVGTNSLRGDISEEQIATDILKLATSIKTDKNDILVSSILPRRDQLKEKAEKVNDFLSIKCSQFNVPFMRHNNIRSEIHLKPKGLHLNTTGSTLLSDNFAAYINS